MCVLIRIVDQSTGVRAFFISHFSVRQIEQRLKGAAVANSGDSGGAKDTSDTGSMSSIGTSDNVNKLHLTYLEVVYGLSSDVSLKKNSTTLNQ